MDTVKADAVKSFTQNAVVYSRRAVFPFSKQILKSGVIYGLIKVWTELPMMTSKMITLLNY